MREADIFVATPDPADRRRSLVSIEPTARVQLFRARAEALLAELVALFDEPHPNGR